MKKIFIIIIILFSKISFAIDVDDAIKSTIENNPKVKIAFEKLEESKELIENAYNQKLPTITSTISGTYSNSDSSTATASTTPESFTDKYKLLLTQNLYDVGEKNLEIERSKILFDKEIINFKISIQDLILSAINGYLTVINYEKSRYTLAPWVGPLNSRTRSAQGHPIGIMRALQYLMQWISYEKNMQKKQNPKYRPRPRTRPLVLGPRAAAPQAPGAHCFRGQFV